MSEMEQVLRNWISQAMSSIGKLPDDADPAQWVAENFANWWRAATEQHLLRAEGAARTIESLHRELGISRRTEDEEFLLAMTEELIERLAQLRECFGGKMGKEGEGGVGV